MKKIVIIFGLILLFLNSCNTVSENPIPHQEKTVYNLCEISSYLGIHGEINGGFHGSFFSRNWKYQRRNERTIR